MARDERLFLICFSRNAPRVRLYNQGEGRSGAVGKCQRKSSIYPLL